LKISDIIPPYPRPLSFLCYLENTQLAQIFQNHILPIISRSEVLLWIWSTVSASIDTLGFALLGVNEGCRAVPSDVMGSELRVTTFLQKLGHTLEVALEFNLGITLGSTLIITVGPKLIFNTFVRVWE
jgi:hypothetical protein